MSRERLQELYLQCKRAYEEAMAIDKDTLRIGTPEWDRWRELNRKMLKAMAEYSEELHKDDGPPD